MLNKYREQIDKIDNDLIELLEQRFEITRQVGEYKKENNIEVLNSDRERAIVSKIEALNLECESQVNEIYLAILKTSKEQQSE